MKSEPQTYSIEDLCREGKTIWDGVRNYQARNFLMQMRVGDLSFFYHSNTQPTGIVGLMKVIKTKVIDASQFEPQSPYYDAKSTINSPRWYTVEVEYVEIFSRIITLDELKIKFTSEEFLAVRKGNRLSVMPVEDLVAEKLLFLTGKSDR